MKEKKKKKKKKDERFITNFKYKFYLSILRITIFLLLILNYCYFIFYKYIDNKNNMLTYIKLYLYQRLFNYK